MKRVTKIIGNMLLVTSLFLSYCSKKEDTPATGNINYTGPSIAKDTLVKLPDQIQAKEDNGNYNLIQLTSSANIINIEATGLSGIFFYDESVMKDWESSKNSDGSNTYKFKYAQFQISLTYYKSSTESWWKYSYDSASYSYPLYYVDDKGTSGEVDWYAKNGSFKSKTVTYIKGTWTKSGTTINSVFNFYSSDGATLQNQYKATSNADKSGTLEYYTQPGGSGSLVLQSKFVWDKTGSGSYINYDSDGTTITSSGTF